MANDHEHRARSDNSVLDYKTAFYGACGLVIVFAGLSFRLFSTDVTDHDAARTLVDQDQSVSIRALEKLTDGQARDIKDCEKQATDLEARVRALEHRGDHR